MTPSELRIGNYVLYRDKETILEVSNLGSNGFETINREGFIYGSDDIEEYNPVLLTEEILFSFGFEKNTRSYDNYVIPGKNFSILFDDDDKQWWINDDESDASCYNVCAVKYVHELQNAFNVLKKEELTLKQ